MKYKLLLLPALVAVAFTGCQTIAPRAVYDPVGYKPKNPSNVRVKVSLQDRMVYVMEGNKPLLVTATAIGLPTKPTPKGNFTVIEKIENKRSGSYGFWSNGSNIIPGTSGQCPGAGYHYVGYAPGYGFHVGSVWPVPRTHGCLRIHQHAARELYELVRIGTPVSIAQTQPEDATLGKNPPRPQDYNDPDPPKDLTISPAAFKKYPSDTLREQP